MHISGTLSCQFLRISMPEGNKILPTKILFETKLTDVEDYYEMKVRMCANESKIAQGEDYTIANTPAVDADSFRLGLVITAGDGMILIFIDASNAFKTNVISNPEAGYI